MVVRQPDAAAVRRALLAAVEVLMHPPVDLEAGLAATSMLRVGIDALQRELVGLARAEGASWAAIGAAMGVSAQAVHQRFGPELKEP